MIIHSAILTEFLPLVHLYPLRETTASCHNLMPPLAGGSPLFTFFLSYFGSQMPWIGRTNPSEQSRNMILGKVPPCTTRLYNKIVQPNWKWWAQDWHRYIITFKGGTSIACEGPIAGLMFKPFLETKICPCRFPILRICVMEEMGLSQDESRRWGTPRNGMGSV